MKIRSRQKRVHFLSWTEKCSTPYKLFTRRCGSVPEEGINAMPHESREKECEFVTGRRGRPRRVSALPRAWQAGTADHQKNQLGPHKKEQCCSSSRPRRGKNPASRTRISLPRSESKRKSPGKKKKRQHVHRYIGGESPRGTVKENLERHHAPRNCGSQGGEERRTPCGLPGTRGNKRTHMQVGRFSVWKGLPGEKKDPPEKGDRPWNL